MSQVAVDGDCLNCGGELRGEFCHSCGQKAASTHLGFHDVLHEVTHEFLHVDGKIINTLTVLVTKPGQLTKDLVEGRRARYIPPLRLYLTLSLVFFFLAAVVPTRGTGAIRFSVTDDNGKVVAPTAEQQRQADEAVAHVIALLPRVLFVLVPLFALLTFGFFRRSQPQLVAHLYFALHMHAFAFLLFTLGIPLRAAGVAGQTVSSIVSLGLIPYYALSFGKFFGGSRWKRGVKGVLIGLIYSAIVVASLLTLTLYFARGISR
jgi:Protein of unknown function (DUF3667)